MTRSEPPADDDLGELRLLASYLDKVAPSDARTVRAAITKIERLRASSSLGGREGGVQREDALTAGAQSQTKAAITDLLAAASEYATVTERFFEVNNVPEETMDGPAWNIIHNQRENARVNLCRKAAAYQKATGVDPSIRSEPPISSPAGALTAEKAAVPRQQDRGPTSLCSDCPPVGYSTDKTRCLPCPFRVVEAHIAAEQTQAPDAGLRSALPPSSARERRMEEALRWFLDDIDGTHTVMIDFDAAVARARAALSSDGRGREKGNTSNSDDGIDPAPPATGSTKS